MIDLGKLPACAVASKLKKKKTHGNQLRLRSHIAQAVSLMTPPCELHIFEGSNRRQPTKKPAQQLCDRYITKILKNIIFFWLLI